MTMENTYKKTDNNGCGRKRAFPTPKSRRAWIIISAVTLSASFVATVAFQQSLPLYHPRSSLSLSRSPTAVRVMTDPTNFVQIETKKSVEDRAALEELYLLSSLAKKAMVRTPVSKSKKTRRNITSVTSPVAGKKKKISTTIISKKKKNTSSNANKIPKETITSAAAADDTTIVEGRTRTINERTKLTKTKTNSEDLQTPKLTQPIYSATDPVTVTVAATAPLRSSKNVHFKGLTTGPNRRNRKKEKSLLPPLSSGRIQIDQDEHIRNILRKKEELLSYDTEEHRSQSAATEVAATSSSTETPRSTFKPPNMLYSSRSSTMPGFIERTNTNRQKSYRDGIKIAEQHSGIEFVDTAASKKKRRHVNGQEMYKTSKSVPDSLVQFANEIHDVDRITPKEEITLGEKTQEAVRLQHIYDGLVANLAREPTDDEWCAAAGKFNMESITQTIEEGLEAKNKLVTSNLRMVQGVVNVYIRNGLQGQYNAGDLMQEGILVSRLQ